MPIVGNGDIASVLPERQDLLFFASGVSNSQETNAREYFRESDLLIQQSNNAHLVYFSSLAVFSKMTKYTFHKLAMEAIVKTRPRYTIIRVGNIDWGTNPHTLINYLRAHPKAKLKDEYRYIVDKDEFLYWINLIPKWNCEMNIIGRRMKVKEVYENYTR